MGINIPGKYNVWHKTVENINLHVADYIYITLTNTISLKYLIYY